MNLKTVKANVHDVIQHNGAQKSKVTNKCVFCIFQIANCVLRITMSEKCNF